MNCHYETKRECDSIRSALRVGQWLGNQEETEKVKRWSHYEGSIGRNRSIDDKARKSKNQNHVY